MAPRRLHCFPAMQHEISAAVPESLVEASLDAVRQGLPLYVEAGELSSDPSMRSFFTKMSQATHFGVLCAVGSSSKKWNPNDFSGSEEALVEGQSLSAALGHIHFDSCCLCWQALSFISLRSVVLHSNPTPEQLWITSLWDGLAPF